MAWLVFLAAGIPDAQAFSTSGPIGNGGDAWQVQALDYGSACNGGVDLVAPKNIGEDYRRTTPVMYYAFDETFLDYFGSNGVAAVDQAFAILNSLTNASSYSASLSEIPLETTRVNQTAGALNLLDLKTSVLYLMTEQLGLADPIRYAWCLHDRYIPSGATCPMGLEYVVTMRNFSIVPSDLNQLQYSSYINGELYSYYIYEYCTANACGALAQTVPIPVDIAENAARFYPVAYGGFPIGGFYTGLTRDDVAALRYLLRSGHVHWEDNPYTSTVYVTNNAAINLQLMVTSNLNLLAEASFTNDDATLLGLYPGLAIVPGSTVPSFTNVVTTNVSMYYTNSPMDPVGTPPHLVTVNTYATNVMFVYTRSFANVITNSFSTRGYVTVIDTSLYYAPLAPVGSPPQTITTTRTTLTNTVSGDFYFIPPTDCGVRILSNVLTTVIGVTNVVVATNAPTTNGGTGTFLLSRAYVNWFTNHSLAYFPVVCATNEPGLRRGVEKLTFVKTTYDSLLGQFYTPQTNYFTMTTVTNNTNWVQTYQRVVTQPDFLFSAADLALGPDSVPGAPVWSRNVNFNSNNILPALAGPGTIDSPSHIVFDKVGPLFINSTSTNGGYFMDQASSRPLNAIWGSFDDSTNAPVVYPNGTSIASLESQMLMQVTTTTLPPGNVRVAYSTQLTGSGGVPPYTWSLASNSPALPSGLALSPNGRLSGTPSASGNSYFYAQMTDTHGAFTVWQVTLTVLP
jgi:hypothetical protein